MNINIEDINETKKSIFVSFSAEEIAKQEQKVLDLFKKKARIPGFRPGKASETIIRKRYHQAIQEELDRAVNQEAYDAIHKKQDIQVVSILEKEGGQGIQLNQSVEIVFKVEVDPCFDLPEYKGLVVTETPVEVSEEDVNAFIERMREERAQYNKVEREALKGDYIKVSYEGKIGDKPIAEIIPDKPIYSKQAMTWEEAGSDKELGVKAVIDGVVGMKAGDKKTVEMDFPASFQEEALAGQKATYDIEVLEVREKSLPEIDETFLKAFHVNDEKALREKIQDQIKSQKKFQYTKSQQEEILEQLKSKLTFPLPESRLEREVEKSMTEIIVRMMQQGASEEDINTAQEEILNKAREGADERAKMTMILEKIAGQEKIQAEQADFQRIIVQEAIYNRMPVDKLAKEISKDRQRLLHMKQQIIIGKTLKFLLDAAQKEPKA